MAYSDEMTNKHPGLLELAGRELSSVEFVRDYIQLHFDGPCLSAYTLPILEPKLGISLASSSLGYADALIGAIGKTVKYADLERDETINVCFNDGFKFRISLLEQDRRGDEAAILTTGGKEIWSF